MLWSFHKLFILPALAWIKITYKSLIGSAGIKECIAKHMGKRVCSDLVFPSVLWVSLLVYISKSSDLLSPEPENVKLLLWFLKPPPPPQLNIATARKLCKDPAATRGNRTGWHWKQRWKAKVSKNKIKPGTGLHPIQDMRPGEVHLHTTEVTFAVHRNGPEVQWTHNSVTVEPWASCSASISPGFLLTTPRNFN